MTAVLEARPVGGALADDTRSGSVRLFRVEAFEPAVYVAPEHRDAYERRFVTLLVDEASRRRGGVGEVLHARNPRGERFALKRLRRSDGERGDDGLAEARRAAFDAEYDAHRVLSPLRGFPRLYGRGRVGEDSVIVMEWVEGVTLEEAARALAVDDEGRLSPLTVARIGRDLFDLLARMAYVEGGLAHRDVAPRNIMIDTGQLSVADQVEEGAFQLVLVDFGSAVPLESADPSLTARWGAPLGATADFAAPEMLTDDVSGAVARRRSPAVDVYAAASVLYQLMEGHSPYDLSFAGRSQREGRSAYRIKTEFSPEMPAGAHGIAADVRAVLASEPEVAVAVGRAAAELDGAPAPHRVRAALSAVDDQLAEVLMACLVPEQSRRPRAREVREALALFCSQYADNVARALRGEPLAPCPLGGAAATEARRRRRLRRAAPSLARRGPRLRRCALGGCGRRRSCDRRASHSGHDGGFSSRSAAMVGADAGTCSLRGASVAPCGCPYRPRQRERHRFRFRARASRVASGRCGSGSSGLAHGMAERVGLGRSLCGAVPRRRRSFTGIGR